LRASVGVHAQDVAAQHRGVELAVGADGDVLRALFAAEVDHVQVRQLVVHREGAGVAGLGGSGPDDGLDGHGPQREVGERGQHQQTEQRESFLQHLVSLLFFKRFDSGCFPKAQLS
jgi:hypothetical protein